MNGFMDKGMGLKKSFLMRDRRRHRVERLTLKVSKRMIFAPKGHPQTSLGQRPRYVEIEHRALKARHQSPIPRRIEAAPSGLNVRVPIKPRALPWASLISPLWGLGKLFAIPLPPFLCLTLLLVLLQPARAQQSPTDATVHLKNGLIQVGKIHAANDKGIQWTGQGTPNPKLRPHSEIARIDFPEPDSWKQGNTFFHAGEYPKAIAAFSSLADNPGGHYYPAPGNYTSRARLRLIECYRETGNVKGIGEVAATLKAESLPKSLHPQMEVIVCWAELSQGNWDAAITKADALAANPILPGREDLGYIKAVALENAGRTQEAITAYGTAYTVDFGASRELAKRAAKNAMLLLVAANDEGREGELHALVHTYAKVYHQGELWEGAPAKAVELLSKELEGPVMEEASTEEESNSKAETTEVEEADAETMDEAQSEPGEEE